MKKYIALLLMVFVIYACGSKEVKSPDFLYGSKLYNNFVDYYLKGQARLAEHAFSAAEHQFLKMDAMCNLSRIYIGRYVIDETGDDPASLDKASEYAALGKCYQEAEAISFLQGGKYDVDKLPEPYKTTAGADTEKLIKYAANDNLPDYSKTRLLRKAAIDLLVKEPERSQELAQEAIELDRFNGWSLNILRDLIIIKLSLEKQGKDTFDIEKRIGLVKTVLSKK